MTRMRIEDPPEDIQREAEKLFNEYINQFSDEDEVPENGYEQYLAVHASDNLKAYMEMIEEVQADAERRGVRI